MTSTTTDLTTVPTKILKTDCKGRIHFPVEMREELLNRFERSGMSGAEFARHYDIKYSTFAYWRQKRRREAGGFSGETPGGGFIEVAVPAPGCGGKTSLRVELPGGAAMRIEGPEQARWAAELLKALGEAGC